MIRRVELLNFKCFIDAAIDLGHLNVFAGSNGTGKSTVLQALLVLFQSVHSGAIRRNRLQLNGPLIDLGTGRDVLYKRSESDRFGINVSDDTATQSFTCSVPVSESHHTLDTKIEPANSVLRSLEQKVLYLSADRLGPQKAYPMNLDESLGNEIGRRGEFAPLLYARVRTNEITNDNLLLEGADKQRFADIETQFTLWMKRLFPGFGARADRLEQMDSVMLGLNLQREPGESDFFRPSNVGFGVSVALPIVLSGLLAGPDSILIVENPEAHLHPSAQSLLGEFLARVTAGGAQVFIETHSDHVINGVRIAYKNQILTPAELRFFAFDKTDEYGSHRITAVELDDAGEFVHRPDSFFDQADKDLKLIYGLG